jgi:hypothetical protein
MCFLLGSCLTVSGYGDKSSTEQFAKSARLPPLATSKEDQIRVWVTVLNSVRGTVVTASSYKEFNNLNSKGLKLVTADKHQASSRIFKHLPALALHAKYSYDCAEDIHGGPFFRIEGVYQGKLFSTFAHLPSGCTSPGYDAINIFLQDAGYQ